MSEVKLKPCPFCGGESLRFDVNDELDLNYGGAFIECQRCCASSAVVFGTKDGLHERWNRRAEQAGERS